MINECGDCNAIREYPDGHKIKVCPRCKSTNIQYSKSPIGQKERNKFLLQAIMGTYKPIRKGI